MKKSISILLILLVFLTSGFLTSCSKQTKTVKEVKKEKVVTKPTEDVDKGESEVNEDKSKLAKLHVEGNHLENFNGDKVQLKGISTHGLSWFPQYVNYDAFKTLKEDWGANVVRLAMYTAEYNGYCTGGDREGLKNIIRDGVKYATELEMYVIIDWHILSDSSPMLNKDEAKDFFREMSLEFKDNPYVIYEICNEPQNSPWSSVIKPYAEEIIPIIRSNSKDALILCGTNTWSQDVDEAERDRLSDKNTMYVMHFYAGTHKDDLRNRLKMVLDKGLPVFVSECSITDASGNGAIDYDSAGKWALLLNDYSVSFVGWSLSNKDESSAILRPSTSSLSGWSDDELSDAGKWFKKMISNRAQ
ncbi:MAG: glycoside hydrolase family 5 protein [Lachnospiraceae bacterium]|nr:glycoside hydrolase family 5 protein [Lachnospiraceae bacterium]